MRIINTALVELFNFYRAYLHIRQCSGNGYTQGFSLPLSWVSQGYVVSLKHKFYSNNCSFRRTNPSQECSEEFP